MTYFPLITVIVILFGLLLIGAPVGDHRSETAAQQRTHKAQRQSTSPAAASFLLLLLGLLHRPLGRRIVAGRLRGGPGGFIVRIGIYLIACEAIAPLLTLGGTERTIGFVFKISPSVFRLRHIE